MNRVVITGATGMLGLALIDKCIANKVEVVAIIRKGSRKRHLVPSSSLVTIVECDNSKLESLSISTDQTLSVFYHFAWDATAGTKRNAVDKQQENIDTSLGALRLAHRLGCGKFVGAGSQAEYGRVDGVIDPVRPVEPDSAYGIAKYAAGRLGAILAEQLGIDFIWTRIFSTYGINDTPSSMIMYCIGSLLRGEKPALTQCEQQWDYLNSQDTAQAFYLLGKRGQPQSVYNIASGSVRPLLEYVCTIIDAINPSLPLGIGERNYDPKQVMCL